MLLYRTRRACRTKEEVGADPIHLTPVGYSKLAEAIIANGSEERDCELNKWKKQEPNLEQRRDGLSRSDLTAREAGSSSHNRSIWRDDDTSSSGRSWRNRGGAGMYRKKK